MIKYTSQRTVLLLLGSLVTVIVVVIFLVLYRSPEEHFTVAVRNLALTIGGFLAAVFAAWRFTVADRQTDIAAHMLLTDRFTKAIDQLGAVNPDNTLNIVVRLGGIWTLTCIAKDSASDRWPILHIFAAYIRHHRAKERIQKQQQKDQTAKTSNIEKLNKQKQTNQLHSILPHDIIAINTAFRCLLTDKNDQEALDLSMCIIPTADLQGVNLSYAILEDTILNESRLDNANLKNIRANCASFSLCSLKHVSLCGASLVEAKFGGSQLQGASLRDAKLQKAYLCNSNLTGADLTRANLSYADLRGAVVTQEQLNSAYGNGDTQIPSLQVRPDHWN